MCKYGAIGALAISVKILCHNGNDSHGDTYEAVLVDADPYYVEPGQPRFRYSPTTTLTPAAFGKPVHGYKPRFNRVQLAKEFFLLVEIWSHEVAHQGEEGRNGKGLVGFADDLVVRGMPVEPERKKS